MPLERTVHLPGEMEELAIDVMKSFPGERVFLLYGDLGSGKTTFVRAFCSVLGIKDIVNSPTFSILNEYGAHPIVYHFDLQRVRSELLWGTFEVCCY